jgi:hypothetical protein
LTKKLQQQGQLETLAIIGVNIAHLDVIKLLMQG